MLFAGTPAFYRWNERISQLQKSELAPKDLPYLQSCLRLEKEMGKRLGQCHLLQ